MNPAATIVIADDDDATRMLLRRILSSNGYDVVEAADGRSACEAVRRTRPDVVVLDWSMPETDGLAALRELKADAATWAIPVLMLTTHAEIDERVRAIEAGAQDFLIKPCDPRELLARIEQQRRWRALVAVESADRAREVAAIELDSLREFSMRDSLTGAPNRHLLGDRIEQTILSSKRRGERFALLFLDLDGFKVVNDTYGHGFGDAVLVTIADRIRTVCRESDTVARYGGDEFVVLAPKLQTLRNATELAERLLVELRRPIEVGSGAVSVGTSIGIAFFPSDAVTAREMIAGADAAMYLAKRAGKNGFRFAEPAQTAHRT